MSRYRLRCTSCDNYIPMYVTMIKKNDIDCTIEEKDGIFYIDIMYVCELYKLHKAVQNEIIITHGIEDDPVIEIYDDWRE